MHQSRLQALQQGTYTEVLQVDNKRRSQKAMNNLLSSIGIASRKEEPARFNPCSYNGSHVRNTLSKCYDESLTNCKACLASVTSASYERLACCNVLSPPNIVITWRIDPVMSAAHEKG